jgi:hypothetical protein
MYTLSEKEIHQVYGGCPVCAVSTTCFLGGAVSTFIGLTAQQLLMISAGGVLLAFSLFYSLYWMHD